ncbi:protein of unknown function [Methylocaldum szegediense]|uniref:Uncharacterized protein n=1 Tax=Methylocaldum szegediense TaxID=73780 RepID=A0ABM9I5U4_9GAMM|nr:protein of unknown function [Methylocaldum szegediense]
MTFLATCLDSHPSTYLNLLAKSFKMRASHQPVTYSAGLYPNELICRNSKTSASSIRPMSMSTATASAIPSFSRTATSRPWTCLPSTLTFNSESPETTKINAGACRIRLAYEHPMEPLILSRFRTAADSMSK